MIAGRSGANLEYQSLIAILHDGLEVRQYLPVIQYRSVLGVKAVEPV